MSATLEPREVEKPFWKRWLRMTWQLFVRSPVRFGILIALLGLMDTSAVKLSSGFVIPKVWVDRLGMLLLPGIFGIICALARGADDARETWSALRALLDVRFWIKALAAGVALIVFEWVVYHALLFFDDPSAKTLYSQKPGVLVTSIAVRTILFNWVLGICFAPLMVFAPPLSFVETRRLSLSASKVNDPTRIGGVICVIMLAGALLTLAPSYGMIEAALLVFLAVLSYVAYRDIFERRDANMPAPAATKLPVAAQLST